MASGDEFPLGGYGQLPKTRKPPLVDAQAQPLLKVQHLGY